MSQGFGKPQAKASPSITVSSAAWGLRWITARKKAELQSDRSPRATLSTQKVLKEAIAWLVFCVLIYHISPVQSDELFRWCYLLGLSPKTSALPAYLPSLPSTLRVHRKLLVCCCPVVCLPFNPFPLALCSSFGLRSGIKHQGEIMLLCQQIGMVCAKL